ncbi:MAG: hypothetical protein ACYCTW_08425, partial [Sulfuricella sp.]
DIKSGFDHDLLLNVICYAAMFIHSLNVAPSGVKRRTFLAMSILYAKQTSASHFESNKRQPNR